MIFLIDVCIIIIIIVMIIIILAWGGGWEEGTYTSELRHPYRVVHNTATLGRNERRSFPVHRA